MNLDHLLHALGALPADPEAAGTSRRAAVRHLARLGQHLTAATLPLAASVLNEAQAQTTTPVADVLNFMLKLEYLQYYFYRGGIGQGSLTTAQFNLRRAFSSANVAALETICRQDELHANSIRSLIATTGGLPIAVPSPAEFDYSGSRGQGGGPFAAVYTSPDVFLVVAQLLKDLAVRAYQGAALLLPNNVNSVTLVLFAANLQSVEARLAARVRTMRRGGPTQGAPAQVAPNGGGENNRPQSPKSWVSGQDGGGPAPSVTAPIYGSGISNSTFSSPNEANTTQTGINVVTAATGQGIPALAFSEAFDEPLDAVTVRTIARLFTVNGSTLFA